MIWTGEAPGPKVILMTLREVINEELKELSNERLIQVARLVGSLVLEAAERQREPLEDSFYGLHPEMGVISLPSLSGEVQRAAQPSAGLTPSGPKSASELLTYLDQLSVEEPACFLSEAALDRLAMLQETPFASASHWRDENPASGE